MMSMDRYLTIQIFTFATAVMLMLTFYMLLMTGMAAGAAIFTPLMLIVLAVICLGIFAQLAKMEKALSRK